MRIYSSANVMQEYLKQPVDKASRILKFISKHTSAKLTIYLPHRIFLKGELICETISEEIDEKFNHNDLIFLLVEEILSHYSVNGNPIKMYRTFKQINSSFLVTRYYEDGEDKLVPLRISIPKKELFKLEMMLGDIDESNPNDFTVERLLELHYMNFMSDLLTGQKEDMIKNIIKLIQED